MSEISDEKKDSKGTGFNGKFPRALENYRERLSKPMPKKALSQHPSKSYLTTIKSIYITERLNSVFGILGWDFEHEVVGIYDNTTFSKEGKEMHKRPFVVVMGRFYIREFDLYTPIQYGGHEIDDKGTDPADGFKSAVTDCMSKCASLMEIGIQVFKGNPESQEANKTMRLDSPEDGDATPLLKPVYDPAEEIEETTEEAEEAEEAEEEAKEEEKAKEEESTEEVSVIDEAMRDEYKRLFGRFPNKTWSRETVFNKMAAKKKEGESEEEPTEEAEVKREPTEPVREVEKAVVVEEGDINEESEEEPFDADKAEEEQNEGAEKGIVEAVKKEINEFVDKDALKEEAGGMLFDAQMEGASDEEQKELKDYVNTKWHELKDAE